MELVLDAPDSFAPVVLHPPAMSDDEFLAFCLDHEDLVMETNAKGEIEIMPPVGPLTGLRNLEICRQLATWARRDSRGSGFDSSAMFVLPNGARRSPDASWMSKARAESVPKSQRDKLWHACPEFVIELRSPSDRKPRLIAKMEEWIENGALLGWLIDPRTRTVTVFTPGQPARVLRDARRVKGEGPVEGFDLDLGEIWA